MAKKEYDMNDKDDWLEINLKALPDEIMMYLEIDDLKACPPKEKELFKAILAEDVKRKYKIYDNWDKTR